MIKEHILSTLFVYMTVELKEDTTSSTLKTTTAVCGTNLTICAFL